MTNTRNNLLSASALILTAVIWGSTFFISKICLSNVNAITLISYRFLLSAAVTLLIILVWRKNPWQNFRYGLLLGSVLLLSYLGQTIGLSYVTASSSGFITGLFVVLVPILGYVFWREKLSIINLVAILLALVGLWIINGGIASFTYGDLLTFGGALAYSFYVLLVDKMIKNDIDPWVLNFQQFLTIGVAALLLAILLHAPLTVHSHLSWYIIIYLGLFAGVIAFGFQLGAQRYISPVKVSLILSLEPVSAAIFAWTIGGEHIELSKALGGMIMIVAIITSQISDFVAEKSGK